MSKREIWLDVAKGLGIAMVVAYHTLEGIKNSFANVDATVVAGATFFSMWLMPMFFIVSGLLARRGLERATRTEFLKRTMNWVYLYVLWSFIIYGVRLSLNSVTNTTMDSREILFILWDPVPTIWFIYALLLSYVLTWLLRNVSPAVVISVALVVNLLNGYFFGWFSGSIFERLAWIYLFYAIGYFYGPLVASLVANNRVGAICSVTFWGALAVVLATNMHLPFYLKPAASVVMAIGFLSQCRWLAQMAGSSWFVSGASYIGSISLFVYLTHFPVPGAMRILLIKMGIYSNLLVVLLAVAMALVAGLVAQRISETGWGKNLFAIPLRSQS